MYSNNEKTDMILIYGECNKKASAVARLCKRMTNEYVKIYETTQLTMFYVF
jgi:hypothetical protein